MITLKSATKQELLKALDTLFARFFFVPDLPGKLLKIILEQRQSACLNEMERYVSAQEQARLGGNHHQWIKLNHKFDAAVKRLDAIEAQLYPKTKGLKP